MPDAPLPDPADDPTDDPTDDPARPVEAATSTRDPDTRFLLANERTLLAWIRTALALLGGGLGLVQFLPTVPLNDVVGLGMLVLGAITFLIGLQRYRSADTAMRAHQLPPKGLAPEVVTIVLFVLAVVLIIVLMTHRAATIAP